VDQALEREQLATIARLFEADVAWARHSDHFYECFIAVVTPQLDPVWLGQLTRRMAAHSGLPLADKVQVTIQRMEPGDHADPHTDRPLLGYEVLRLVVQLTEDWHPEDGGLFRAFDGDTAVLECYPAHNRGVVFALTHDSLHEVTPTQRTRCTAVFNFWHIGNTDALKEAVDTLFSAMDFSTLPHAVNAAAALAETTEAEADSHRASTVAIALTAWGYAPQEAAAGYRLALGPPVDPAGEIELAVELARWLARLHTEDFDAGAWRAHRDRLAPHAPARHDRLRRPWTMAFPAP
jgi:hypothetical protein